MSRNGQQIHTFESDKVRALLAYLAVESNRVHQRSALATLLWPEHSEESARTTLRHVLHELRKTLGDAAANPPFLLITRQSLQFNPNAAYTLDVTDFQACVASCKAHAHAQLATCPQCRQRLTQAVALYEGDFLAGFNLRDSVPFEEWRRLWQERLHLEALEAFSYLADGYEAEENWATAHTYALRMVAMEAWREETHRQIMRLLAQSGQRAAAIAQYQQCCQILMDELGIEPDAVTTKLYEQILSGLFQGKPKAALVERDAAQPSSQAESAVHRQVDHPSSPNTSSPNTSSPNTLPPVHNAYHFPVQATPFVGRTAEVNSLSERIQHPTVRLITLVGPGGIGKTRLAHQVGHRQLAHFSDGVFFVSLAGLNEPTGLAAEIISVVGLSLHDSEPEQTLLQFLRHKQLLLILDNFEHIVSAAMLVVDLLQASPGLKVIVTTRERLNTPGEHLFVVDGLPYPTDNQLEKAGDSTAVQLFVQSGQRVLPSFQLNSATAPAILSICRLVQGMPLALELAAAWLEILPVSAIADEIGQSTDFLAIDWRTMPARQQSMRAVFAWSWQLLTEGERQTFRRLSIFAGGFTREAAERVTGASLRTLASLIHKSLLRATDPQAATPRFYVHELLRQFAAEQLQATDEAAEIAAQHSEFYLAFVATHEDALLQQKLGSVITQIQGELDNIRQAWMWAADHKIYRLLDKSITALAHFYFVTGMAAQGCQLFQHATQSLQADIPAEMPNQEAQQQRQHLLSSLYASQAELAVMMGQYEEGITLAEQGIKLGLASGNYRGEALGHFLCAKVLGIQGNYAEAKQRLLQTRRLVQTYQQNRLVGNKLNDTELSTILWLGHLAMLHDDFGETQAYFSEGLCLSRAMNRKRGEVSFLLNLAGLAVYVAGDFATARQHYQLALEMSTKLGYRWGEGSARLELGETLRLQGEYSAALDFYQQSLIIFQDIHHPLKASYALISIARLHLYWGDHQRARAEFGLLVESPEGLTDRNAKSYLLLALATLEYQLAHYEQALLHVDAGLQAIGDIGHATLRVAYWLVAGHSQSGLQRDDAAWAHYAQAVVWGEKLGLAAFTAEARAGLATIAGRKGNLAAALQHVEAILAILSEHPYAGYDEPFFVYLTCYRILAATDDARACQVLSAGHNLLQEYASHIHDEANRRSFWENVPVHHELHQAYVAYHKGCDTECTSIHNHASSAHKSRPIGRPNRPS